MGCGRISGDIEGDGDGDGWQIQPFSGTETLNAERATFNVQLDGREVGGEEGRGPKSEVRGQRSEVRGRRTEGEGQR